MFRTSRTRNDAGQARRHRTSSSSTKQQQLQRRMGVFEQVVEAMEPRRLLSTYYVSTSGSDSGAGTSTGSGAFRTLQHAADVVKAGDVVHVASGSYVGMNLFGKA